MLMAAKFGCANVVRKLVGYYGCSLEIRTKKEKQAALHLAAWHGHADVVKLLLELGADKNSTNRGGETPLQCAEKAEKKWESGEYKFPTFGRESVVDFRDRDPGWPYWGQVIHLLKLQNASSDLVSDLELSRTGLMEMTIDQQQARTS